MAIDKLSFWAVDEHPANVTEKFRARSRSGTAFELHVTLDGDFDQPVDLTRLMSNAGMTLTCALEFVNELSGHRSAKAVVVTENISTLISAIEQLDLKCSITARKNNAKF